MYFILIFIFLLEYLENREFTILLIDTRWHCKRWTIINTEGSIPSALKPSFKPCIQLHFESMECSIFRFNMYTEAANKLDKARWWIKIKATSMENPKCKRHLYILKMPISNPIVKFYSKKVSFYLFLHLTYL